MFLRCTVNSNPPARFIWKRGSHTLSHSQDNGVDIYEPLYTQVRTGCGRLSSGLTHTHPPMPNAGPSVLRLASSAERSGNSRGDRKAPRACALQEIASYERLPRGTRRSPQRWSSRSWEPRESRRWCCPLPGLWPAGWPPPNGQMSQEPLRTTPFPRAGKQAWSWLGVLGQSEPQCAERSKHPRPGPLGRCRGGWERSGFEQHSPRRGLRRSRLTPLGLPLPRGRPKS